MNTKKVTFGLIGVGNMGSALLNALISAPEVKFEKILIHDNDSQKYQPFKKQSSITIAGTNKEVIEESAIVCLAVKPQVFPEILPSLASYFRKSQIIISIAAGIPTSYLQSFIKKGKIVRAMPNTACMVKAGFTALTSPSSLQKEEKEILQLIFSRLGSYMWLEEKHFHVITGLSGSGPAYIFSFVEGLIEGAIKMGLPRDIARKAAIQTIQGSMELLETSRKSPSQLKEMVTSPGGTTIHGLEALYANRFHHSLMQAVSTAAKQSETLEENLFKKKDNQ